MHPLWTIPELVAIVLSHLSYDSLANVARCNRALFAPSVAYLWRKLEYTQSFSALYESMQAVHVTNITHHYERALSRWALYTGSVRIVDTSVANAWGVIEELASIVSGVRLHEDGRLFPRLESVNISMGNYYTVPQEVFRYCMVLLSPLTKTISMDGLFQSFTGESDNPSDLNNIHSFLRLLAVAKRCCPLMEELFLQGLVEAHRNGALLQGLADLLSGWTSLQRVGGGHWILEEPILRALAHLPSLKRLSIHDWDIAYGETWQIVSQTLSSYIGSTGFPSLTSLDMAGTAREITALITSLGPLEELTVTFKDVPVYMGNLVSSRSPRLKYLTWRHAARSAHTINENITGLLSCRHLRYFEFLTYARQVLPWDDELVSRVAVSWPFLRHFTLSSLGDAGSLCTYASLISLATGCPLLETLRLRINSTASVPFPPEVPLRHQKIVLQIGPLPPDYSAAQIATFLFSIWPNAYMDEYPTSPHSRPINDIMKSFRYLMWARDARRNIRSLEELPMLPATDY